jgi:trimethylamine:corrinoid methyltransferase-like protein
MASPSSPLSLLGRVEPNEPLDWADWIWAAIEAGVALPVAPCGILGGTSPVTVASLITQNVAEFLAMLVAIQTANPGHPTALGDFSGAMDMITGEKGCHRPEAVLVHLGTSAMAQYYGKPSLWETGSAESPMADAQSAWERTQSYLMAFLAGGIDVVMSGGGLGYLRSFDMRELLVDNEIIGRIKHMSKGINMGEESIPLDLMIKTGFGSTGASFLSTKHTKRFYKSELWKRSSLTSALNADKWLSKGGTPLLERANEILEDTLSKYAPNISKDFKNKIREFLNDVLRREKVDDDKAKRIMDKTYWHR